eukprot:161989_1
MGACGTKIQNEVKYLSNTVDPLNHIYAERNTVCGYVREIKELLLNEKRITSALNKSYVCVHDNIVSIIAFYLYYYKPKFDRTIINRDYIHFISNAVVTIKKKCYWSTLTFGSELNGDVCNKFDIHIRVELIHDFVIGYVKQNVFMNTNTNYFLGKFEESVGIYINVKTNTMKLYNTNNETGKILKHNHKFKYNDTYVLSINFENDYLELYHKDRQIIQLSLNGCKQLFPAFSLSGKSDLLEVVRWKLK